jgi:hypothetical protein
VSEIKGEKAKQVTVEEEISVSGTKIDKIFRKQQR